MKLSVEYSVVVITPTVGRQSLVRAIESVKNQTYQNVKHLVVVDGPEYLDSVNDIISEYKNDVTVTTTPFNTGGNGYFGHRIYAAYSHLIDQDYVAFLDEDNWYEINHIETLVATLESRNYDWVHSLRKVYIEDTFLADDCCESIGRWPIWFSQPKIPQHLVDTSTYLFKKDFLTKVASHWHSGWGGDRRFFSIITNGMDLENNYDTSSLHTLNYKLPDMNKAYGGDLKFFEKGNAAIKQRYGGKYPWN